MENFELTNRLAIDYKGYSNSPQALLDSVRIYSLQSGLKMYTDKMKKFQADRLDSILCLALELGDY